MTWTSGDLDFGPSGTLDKALPFPKLTFLHSVELSQAPSLGWRNEKLVDVTPGVWGPSPGCAAA